MSCPTVALGDVVSFKGGGTPSRDEPKYWGGDIPWATVKDFNDGYLIRTTQEFITTEGLRKSASNLVSAGTVIIPTRMALGKAVITQIDLAINQDLKAVIPNGAIEPRYLLWYFIANASRINSMGKGATVKGVTLDQLRRLSFPLPPLPEQRRIAAILDKADALRDKRREAIAKLDKMLQSVFLEMFGDQASNPKKWPEVLLSEAVNQGTIVTYGIVQAGKEFSGGIPYIRTGDISAGGIVEVGLRRTDPIIAKKFSRSRVEAGDIVMSIRATVGTTALVPKSLDGANLTQGTARIAVGENIARNFALHHLRSAGTQRWIERQVKGATFREITLGRLRELPMMIPPRSLQDKFDLICRHVNKSALASKSSLAGLEKLFASLQQRAFEGEL